MSTVAVVSQRLFEALRQAVPTPAEWQARHGHRPGNADNFSAALGSFYAQAKQFRREYRLGILSRARVALALQRNMQQAGYPAGMTRQILFSMIVLAFVGKV